MNFPFKWIPEPKWQIDRGQVLMIEMNPESVLPSISVQCEWNGCRGIVRGVKDSSGFLVEDHICEEIRDGHPVDVDRRIVGADEMRKQVWTIDQHISAYRSTNTNEQILGWVGNGNLLSNPHFVAFVKGQLISLGSEIQYLSSRSYTSLVVRKPGYKRVSIEPVNYRLSSGGTQMLNTLGGDITGEVEYATFGQQIVRQGQPISRDELKRIAVNKQFYDFRHLFLFGRMSAGDKRWLDIGLGGFWDNGVLDIESVKAAFEGNPIQVDVRQFDETAILSAMGAKGYYKVDEPKERGQFSLRNQKLTVILLDGLYPHNMIGVRKDGVVISVVLRGLSNRLGVSILGAAELMASLGAQDALILDNGADVMMCFDGDQVLGSPEGERYRLRSVILFRKEDARTELAPNDFRLVSYPKQASPST
jgi:hypothetical protein